jgi:serine protease Do
MKYFDALIYGGLLAGITLLSSFWHDQSMAPEAPPPLSHSEIALFAAFTPFAPGSIISVPPIDHPEARGTAFSVGASGEWVVQRKALENCSQPYLALGGNLGIPVKVRPSASLDNYQLVVSNGGVRPLPLAIPETIRVGNRGFMPGFPHGEVGEATGRLIGQTWLRKTKRNQHFEPVLVWAEAGHTYHLSGSLEQISGGPVLNEHSEVMGIVRGYKPRRGIIYSSTPETLAKIANPADRRPDFEQEDTITRRNYGIVSDTLRRQYRVMQIACLMG